jgi:hypothetical protein
MVHPKAPPIYSIHNVSNEVEPASNFLQELKQNKMDVMETDDNVTKEKVEEFVVVPIENIASQKTKINADNNQANDNADNKMDRSLPTVNLVVPTEMGSKLQQRTWENDNLNIGNKEPIFSTNSFRPFESLTSNNNLVIKYHKLNLMTIIGLAI